MDTSNSATCRCSCGISAANGPTSFTSTASTASTAVDGPAGGVKVATETYETTTEPDGRQHPPTAAKTVAMYRHCIDARLPWLGPKPVRTLSCLYTCTRGSRFVIDRHPRHEAVLIVSPCSGHGFKHSPAIGEAVSQRVTEGRPELDLDPFRLSHAVR